MPIKNSHFIGLGIDLPRPSKICVFSVHAPFVWLDNEFLALFHVVVGLMARGRRGSWILHPI